MRIVFVDTTTDSDMIGGGHLILPSLMEALKKRGHEIHLVTKGKANPKLQPFIDASGAEVHISPWKKKAPVEIIAPIFNEWLKELKPDVYVISSSAAIGWVVLPYIDPYVPTFTIGHNNENTFYLPVKHYHSFLTNAIGVSHQICDEYIQQCNMSEENVEWIPYGVDAAEVIAFSKPEEPLKIVYVGRVEEEQKRVPDLVKVISELYKNGVPFKMSIVGDGPYMPALKEALKAEVENTVVQIKGWLEKEKVLSELRAADVFILTSSFEGFSIALTEAMANGCCPVVTDIPSGSQQLIRDGENGHLINVGDIQGFVKVLSEMSAHKEKLNEMRNSAWETGKQFSLNRMAEHYESVFKAGILYHREMPRVTNPGFQLMSTCMSSYPLLIRTIKMKLTKRQTI
jgi:glycosyltransferase involved in cell wall biosynthesis